MSNRVAMRWEVAYKQVCITWTLLGPICVYSVRGRCVVRDFDRITESSDVCEDERRRFELDACTEVPGCCEIAEAGTAALVRTGVEAAADAIVVRLTS